MGQQRADRRYVPGRGIAYPLNTWFIPIEPYTIHRKPTLIHNTFPQNVDMDLIQLVLGLALGAAVALLAWGARALSTSGAWAAALTGGLIFGLGSWPWAILLLAFFISSSGLSRLFKRRKADVHEKFEKGSQRDWGQVLANGGIGTVLVVVQALMPEAQWPWLAYAGSLAAVNADTWATELGVLAKNSPRLITTWEKVTRGTSGGVTFFGTLASLAGAALIAFLAAILLDTTPFITTVITVSLAGLAGSLFDSLLGATVQVMYYHPESGDVTEKRLPSATVARGWAWMSNDWVNLLASLLGAGVATLWFF